MKSVRRHQHRKLTGPLGCPRAQYRQLEGTNGEFIQGKKIHPAARDTVGTAHRRVLITRKIANVIFADGRFQTRVYEETYHATKGWRRVWDR